jgi:outer membrane receptor for ferrienterochelin and colicins
LSHFASLGHYFLPVCNKGRAFTAFTSTIRDPLLTIRIRRLNLQRLQLMVSLSTRRTKTFILQTTIAAVLFAPSFVSAQETGSEDSTVVYPAEYFTEYAPTSAQDMLDRIPGLTGGPSGGFGGGNSGSGGRGFGGGSGGSEVLINGKRTAGKNNQTSDVLRRIAATQVNEIQIIRGTSGDLDVRGSGQVINVVLTEELSANSVSYGANVSRSFDSEMRPGGSAALSGKSGDLTFLLSGNATSRYENSLSREVSKLGDFSPNDAIKENRIRDQMTYEFSTNLGYDISANSSVRLNALYGITDAPNSVRRVITNQKVNPNTLTTELEDIPNEKDNWEVGSDYEYRTATGNRFKLLAIANKENNDTTRERFKVLSDSSTQKNLFIDTKTITDERIVRSSFTMGVTDTQDIEFGVERAQTILDSELILGLLSSTGTPSPAAGGLVPQKVSNANSQVEELRYEPFAIHNWQINSQMSLETTLLYETSTITQTGDVSNVRDFNFVKPKIDFRYDMTSNLQLRGTIEKVVNQLSFNDFVAANDDQDNDASTQAGNAQLRQEWLWKYNFRTEYRIPNDVGVLTSDFFYFQHNDVIERLDVTRVGGRLQSANGNIGDGWQYGMNLSASVRMGMVNLPNLLLTSTLNLQDSEITDPFLGIKRRFQNFQRGRFTLEFRHDLPSIRANWGMQYFDRVDGGMSRYDLEYIEKSVGDPRVNLFLERVDRRGITYRFDAGALTNGQQYRERYRYVGRASNNILEEFEDWQQGQGIQYSFKINGSF